MARLMQEYDFGIADGTDGDNGDFVPGLDINMYTGSMFIYQTDGDDNESCIQLSTEQARDLANLINERYGEDA